MVRPHRGQGSKAVQAQTLEQLRSRQETPLREPVGAASSARIAALFPFAVAAAEVAGTRQPAPLHPGEGLHLRQAAPRRWRDFAAGRDCARHALARLGVAAAALLPQDGGGPRWPDGIAGSISHTEGLCGAVACHATAGFSLGLDIERLAPLDADTLAAFATPAERSWLEALAPAEAARLAVALFSAKEAFYKCQHPLTGRWLEFHDASLRLHADGRVELAAAPPGLDPARYAGRYRVEAGHVLTGFWTAG
jgi:4'-phosphopantetheinyl transferase EntD